MAVVEGVATLTRSYPGGSTEKRREREPAPRPPRVDRRGSDWRGVERIGMTRAEAAAESAAALELCQDITFKERVT